jgi:hypothetical protein
MPPAKPPSRFKIQSAEADPRSNPRTPWRAVAANTIFVNFEELPDDLSNMYRVFRLPFLEILKFEVHHGLIMFSSMLVGAAQADLRGFGLGFTKGWFTGEGSPACEYFGSMCEEVPLVVD